MAINLPIVSKYDDKGAKEAQSSLSKLGTTVAGIGIAAAAAAGAAGVALLTKTLSSGFDRLVSIDNATAKLEGLGHSAASVQTIMDSALASVKGTAFGLGDAATIAANAVAAGIQPGQELTKYLTLTADAAAIAGVSLEEMGSTMNNVRTIGAAYNDSLQIMAQKGIPIYTMLADELGITTDAVKTLASEGGISADLFEKVMQDKFGGAALKAGDTVEGSIANMEAAFGRLGAALLGTTFEGLPAVFADITKALDGMLPQFEAIGAELGPILIETFKQLMEALLPLIAPLMQIIGAILPPLAQLIAAIAPIVGRLIEALLPLIEAILPVIVTLFEALLPPILTLLEAALVPLIDIVLMLVEAFAPVIEAVLPIFVKLIEAIAPIVTTLIEAFMPLLEAILEPLIDIILALVPVIEAWLDAMIPLWQAVLPLIIELIAWLVSEGMKPFIKMLQDAVPVIETIADVMLWWIENVLKPGVEVLTLLLTSLKDIFAYNNKQVNFKVTGSQSSAISGQTLQGGRIPNRAAGGGAANTGLSWVGEKGPELITMPRGATVTPIPQHMRADAMFGANRNGGGGNTTVLNITVNGGLDSSAQIGEAVVNAIRKYERTSGAVFARA